MKSHLCEKVEQIAEHLGMFELSGVELMTGHVETMYFAKQYLLSSLLPLPSSSLLPPLPSPLSSPLPSSSLTSSLPSPLPSLFQGKLTGQGLEQRLPTITLVAHYDAMGVATVSTVTG